MQMNDYQDLAGQTAQYPAEQGMVYTVLGLASEAGELAGKLKKVIRDRGGVIDAADREAMAYELSDIAWYVAMVAKELGYSLNQIAEMNVLKLRSRKERGVIGGSGDSL